jgi:hypothetical protein
MWNLLRNGCSVASIEANHADVNAGRKSAHPLLVVDEKSVLPVDHDLDRGPFG